MMRAVCRVIAAARYAAVLCECIVTRIEMIMRRAESRSGMQRR